MNRPKGTKDIFGKDQIIMTSIKNTLRSIATIYNFHEIDTPIFERKEVFVKSVGETSDIVSKEMYEFKDKKGREMVLRPEGTAGVIRAIVENKLFINEETSKVFYMGPMFRYENPQKGRQRQFTQFGVEMISERNAYADAEIILMADFILKALQLENELLINSLGDKATRENYSNALRKYFIQYKSELSPISIKRIETNPMRILDDKIDGPKDFVKNAPRISDFYSDETREYFKTLTDFLDIMNIKYTIDHTLVRGLDYYTDTSFEFISKSKTAGAQSTLIGGGRYSGLIESFGGPSLSGIGFGVGIERIVNDIRETFNENELQTNLHAYVCNIDPSSQSATARIVQMLRSSGLVVEWNKTPTKLVKTFVKADKSNAHYKIIAGPEELARGAVMVKHHELQEEVLLSNLVDYIVNDKGHRDYHNDEEHPNEKN
ncbi:histidine--tRNA ligase [Candidatus Mycoplasma mahonii]|uniref:histidine--tRNA ligase n=1 Tax=Candidatus Mycoplasma mahonii TaxID=3004105 RepID=UPI0026EFDD7F|nr:histidine--tRNA ligase [Candidatus Mycoplasma mahonii]WKX02803.1 histidine--tRNA ligase [Candidatus Mycoplasma mahonii]